MGPDFERGLYHVSNLLWRVNPGGLALVTETGYRLFLYDSDHLLLSSARLDMGLDGRVSPANVSGGPYVEIVPLAFLRLRLTLRPNYYWGAFGSLFVVDDVDSDWSPDAQRDVRDAGEGVADGGLMLTFDGVLQGKVGPIVFLHDQHYWQYWMGLDSPYLEGRYYLLMEPNDAIWWMATTVGYTIGRDPTEWFLIIGARHDMMRTRVHRYQRHLLGGAMLWKIPTSWVSWGNPMLAMLVEVYVDDPWRRGEPYWIGQLTFQF